MAKTDWKITDTVQPSDMNDIGQEINDNANNLAAHKAETVQDGVHGMGAAAAQEYEVGSWSPTLAFGGDTTGITYSGLFGRYTRIGSVVMLQARIPLTSKGTAVGIATIEDLPYAKGSYASEPVLVYWRNVAYTSNQNTILGRIVSGANAIILECLGDNVGAASLTNAQFADDTVLEIQARYSI